MNVARNVSLQAFAAFLCVGALVSACNAPTGPLPEQYIKAPDFAQFADDTMGVHRFLERRCGTLDCHGQTGRPFRLFSMGGLRLLNDSGVVSGLGADSPEEVYANYQALVGLQPEETSKVVSGLEPPTTLLVLAKPLALQTHKGGAELAPGDPGDLCLESWLSGQIDTNACTMAIAVP
jgi:hypothetical protein